MKRKIAPWLLGCTSIVLLAGGFAAWHYWSIPAAPHVLLITLDTTRADHIGCYGYDRALTSCFDRLAAQGIVFENALTCVPLTLPAHATIHTGRLPPEHGLRINGAGSLPRQIPTLAERFQNAGYDTGAFVAGFVLNQRFGLNRGFDHYDDEVTATGFNDDQSHRRRPANVVVDRTIAWLKESRRPTFCWMHLYDPHHPCQEHRAEFGDRFAGRGYDAEIAFADQQVARLLDFLKSTGDLKNTLVVVVGDHGEGLNEHQEHTHGNQLYQTTLHVPLIVSWPEKFAVPRRISAGVGLADLFPTILDVMGLEGTPESRGRSLKPAALGQQLASVPLYAETYEPYYAFHYAWQNAVVHEGWKYIHSPEPELYDLSTDPGESQNLWSKVPDRGEQLATILRELKSRMQPIRSDEASLDERARRTLETLGYTRQVRSEIPPDGDFRGLLDVKQAMPPYRLTSEAIHFRDAGQINLAIEKLRLAVQNSPKFRYARVYLAETLAMQAQDTRDEAARSKLFAEAEEQCRTIIREEVSLSKTEKNAVAQMVLGQVLSETNRFKEANAAFDAAAQIFPDWPQLYFSWAMSLEREGNAEAALAKHRVAIELDPAQIASQMRIAEGLLSRSATLKSSSKPDDQAAFRQLRTEALEHLSKAIKGSPLFGPAYLRAFSVYAEDGQWREAEQVMRSLVTADAQSVPGQYLLAVALIRQQRADEAGETLRKLLRQVPQHQEARQLLQSIESLKR